MRILLIICLLFSTAFAAERVDKYDKNWNRTGYKNKERDRTVVYDKNWNKVGYEKDGKIYDKNWNKKGYRK